MVRPISDDPDMTVREREQHAITVMLHDMTGEEDLTIDHEENGKPKVRGWYISISHTRGWAALILSKIHEVSIDIEYRSDRVDRVAQRFLRDDETAADTLQRLLIWCGKETAYKYWSADNLMFSDIRCTIKKETILAENIKRGESVLVSYCFNDDYVLTFIQ